MLGERTRLPNLSMSLQSSATFGNLRRGLPHMFVYTFVEVTDLKETDNLVDVLQLLRLSKDLKQGKQIRDLLHSVEW